MKDEYISRQAAISAICNACGKIDCDKMDKCEKLQLSPANCSEFPNNSDTISRKWLVECLEEGWIKLDTEKDYNRMIHLVRDTAPSVQIEKEVPIRVRWSGWKGHRNTKYFCPNCEKPVRHDDCYCHRCGQKLMFPKISFSDYVPGEKQQTIVTWEDEKE